MLGVVLLILKIIGIVLLIVVAILLYLLLAPVFYEVNADFDKKHYRVHIHDPIYLFFVGFDKNDEKSDTEVRVLFKLIKLRLVGKKKENQKDNKPQKEEKPARRIPSVNPGMIKKFASLIFDESNRAVLKLVFNKLKKLLKSMLPRRIIADIEFGLDSPDTTGYVTGLLAAIPAGHSDKIHIYPDFSAESKYISGSLFIGGWIMLIRFLIMGISLFANKDFRRLIRHVKN